MSCGVSGRELRVLLLRRPGISVWHLPISCQLASPMKAVLLPPFVDRIPAAEPSDDIFRAVH